MHVYTCGDFKKDFCIFCFRTDQWSCIIYKKVKGYDIVIVRKPRNQDQRQTGAIKLPCAEIEVRQRWPAFGVGV